MTNIPMPTRAARNFNLLCARPHSVVGSLGAFLRGILGRGPITGLPPSRRAGGFTQDCHINAAGLNVKDFTVAIAEILDIRGCGFLWGAPRKYEGQWGRLKGNPCSKS